jgi:hypothetical protein
MMSAALLSKLVSLPVQNIALSLPLDTPHSDSLSFIKHLNSGSMKYPSTLLQHKHRMISDVCNKRPHVELAYLNVAYACLHLTIVISLDRTKTAFRIQEDDHWIRFATMREKDPELGIRVGQLKIKG